MADSYITINAAGDKEEKQSTSISTGAADDGKIVALNTSGFIDDSMLNITSYGSLITNVSGSYTLDCSLHNKWELVLQADTKIYFDTSGMPADNTNVDLTIVLRQDDIGGRIPTFQYGSIWPNSTTPTFTTTPGAKDVVTGFHLHSTALWYLRPEGFNYAGVLDVGINLTVSAALGITGSYIITGASALVANAVPSISGGIIQPFSAALAASAAITVAGHAIFGGSNPSTSSAFITAAATVEYTGAAGMSVTATADVVGGVSLGSPIDMTVTATFTGDAEVYLFVEGVAAMTANSTVAPLGNYIVHGPASLEANSTIAASATSGVPMSVILTDCTDIDNEGDPLGADFSDEGMTITVTGGTAPYTYIWEVLQIREWADPGWDAYVPGCSPMTGLRTDGPDYNFTSCATTSAMSEADMNNLVNMTPKISGNTIFGFEIKVTVTDDVSSTASDTAFCRFANLY